MRHWTEETDREADELYPTFSTAKIRQYQDLCTQQTRMAWEQHNDDALADLQCMSDALIREMFRRAWGVRVEGAGAPATQAKGSEG